MNWNNSKRGDLNCKVETIWNHQAGPRWSSGLERYLHSNVYQVACSRSRVQTSVILKLFFISKCRDKNNSTRSEFRRVESQTSIFGMRQLTEFVIICSESFRIVFVSKARYYIFLMGFQVFASFFITYLGCKMMQKCENMKTRKHVFLQPRQLMKNDAKTLKPENMCSV